MEPSRSAGLFKKGREALFSAERATEVEDLPVAGAKAAAEPASRVAMASFIMVGGIVVSE